MNENSKVVRLRRPDEIDDPLTKIRVSGARQLLAQAIELEAEAFLAEMKGFRLADGRDRVVRHGHGPERTIQTGIGAVKDARGKIRDRGAASDGERIRFTSAILPLWARRTKSLDALLPVLYLRGISTGDFQEALSALLGKDAPNLSPAVISRLTAEWQGEYERWQKRDLSAREQSRTLGEGQHEEGSGRGLLGAEPGFGGGGDRHLRREIRSEVRQGGRVPDQGSPNTACALQLSCRALGSPAHDESHRKRVCDGPAQDGAYERLVVVNDCQADGLQANLRRVKDLAATQRYKSLAEGHRRRQIPRRHRGHPSAGKPRRLIASSPKIPHSSILVHPLWMPFRPRAPRGTAPRPLVRQRGESAN